MQFVCEMFRYDTIPCFKCETLDFKYSRNQITRDVIYLSVFL